MPRKHFTTSLDEKLLKAIKKLATDLNCTVNDLLEEGVEYLLKRYKSNHKKYPPRRGLSSMKQDDFSDMSFPAWSLL